MKRAELVHGSETYDWSKTEYKGSDKMVTVICPKHHAFSVPAGKHIHAKQACPKCVGKYKRTTAEFIEDAQKTHRDDYDYSNTVFTGVDAMVTYVCRSCKAEVTQLAYSHLIGKGCNWCNESQGERSIRYFLDEQGIQYEREKRFPDCVDQRPLRFDFCLTNLKTLIEFDGRQHFEVVPAFGGQDAFEAGQRRDDLNNTWAADNGWRMIRIRFDEDAASRLDEELGS